MFFQAREAARRHGRGGSGLSDGVRHCRSRTESSDRLHHRLRLARGILRRRIREGYFVDERADNMSAKGFERARSILLYASRGLTLFCLMLVGLDEFHLLPPRLIESFIGELFFASFAVFVLTSASYIFFGAEKRKT
jgi:hypothetical protein